MLRVAPPKTKAGIRTLPLPALVVTELLLHLSQYAIGPAGLPFTTPAGTVLNQNDRRHREWNHARLRTYGIPPDVTFHRLRHTRSPDPNAKPTGRRTVVQGDPATRRALELENESADTLAKAGYDVEQNPDVSGPRNPDYRIEGKVFDNYAPHGNENTVYQTIGDKVAKGQADRLVLNLADSRQDAGTISQWLKDYPVNGLKEVIFINKDGTIQDLVLP